jgi:hypothetical protein
MEATSSSTGPPNRVGECRMLSEGDVFSGADGQKLGSLRGKASSEKLNFLTSDLINSPRIKRNNKYYLIS